MLCLCAETSWSSPGLLLGWAAPFHPALSPATPLSLEIGLPASLRQLCSSTLDVLDKLKQWVLFWGYCKRRHSNWWEILMCVHSMGGTALPCPVSGQLWEAMLQWENGSGRQRKPDYCDGEGNPFLAYWCLKEARLLASAVIYLCWSSSLSQGNLSLTAHTSLVQRGWSGELCSHLAVAFPTCPCQGRRRCAHGPDDTWWGSPRLQGIAVVYEAAAPLFLSLFLGLWHICDLLLWQQMSDPLQCQYLQAHSEK